MDASADDDVAEPDALLMTEAHALTLDQLLGALKTRGIQIEKPEDGDDKATFRKNALRQYQKHVAPQPKRPPRHRRRRASKKRQGDDIHELDMEVAATHISTPTSGKKFKHKSAKPQSTGIVPTDAEVKRKESSFVLQPVTFP
eukprot:TRINITY_DN24657_c0_g1_i1.p1 TRINITY_DN24657_c0_g1~~TRINITY_DN24657_c0_g1_i1.p1  ORF type:complete len:165 (+),score=32.39 TRINITY_DN24657_c0_g1_i1:67-495(+)